MTSGKQFKSQVNSSQKKYSEPIAVAVADPKVGTVPPRIIASGRGQLAEQILELAFANGVKVREDPDLVQILSALEIDTEIPVEAFAAVAEILNYLYRINGVFKPELDGTYNTEQNINPQDWTSTS